MFLGILHSLYFYRSSLFYHPPQILLKILHYSSSLHIFTFAYRITSTAAAHFLCNFTFYYRRFLRLVSSERLPSGEIGLLPHFFKAHYDPPKFLTTNRLPPSHSCHRENFALVQMSRSTDFTIRYFFLPSRQE